MNNRNTTLSLISDRTIGTKVAAGFAIVLFILAVSSVLAWLAFGRASGDSRRLHRAGHKFRDLPGYRSEGDAVSRPRSRVCLLER